MPVTIDRILGKPLFHSHQMGDISVGTNGSIDLTKVVMVTTNTSPNSETVVLVNASSGNITISLPQAANSANKAYKIKKTDSSSNVVNISAYNNEKIDGETIKTILFQYTTLQLVSDGNNWYII